jgi:hypothetical protein
MTLFALILLVGTSCQERKELSGVRNTPIIQVI